MKNKQYYILLLILLAAIISINLFIGCSSSSDSGSGTTEVKHQFAIMHDSTDYVTRALQEKGVNLNKITQDPDVKYEALVVNGSEMTASQLASDETVKAYLQNNKGLLVLNATGDHKKALIKYVGMSYGSHDTKGYFVTRLPGSKGREFAIYEHPRMLEIKAEDFSSTTDMEIDTEAHEKAQQEFLNEVETKLGPRKLAENIINQLEENKLRLAGTKSREDIPDGLKYRQWRIPNDTQYWQLILAWLKDYPAANWVYPTDSFWTKPAYGYQTGSFGHNTFISVYLDNRPSNGGDNYQWFSVDFQGWSEPHEPGPNSEEVEDESFKMPMAGESHEVIDTKNYNYDGWGWGQMVYLMSFIPDTGAETGIKNYQALPDTDNSSTTYSSGSSFNVGFNMAGATGNYQVSNTVATSQLDWKVVVKTDLSKPSYGWSWQSNNPSSTTSNISSMNSINLMTFQPNSSGVMITDEVIDDVRTFNFSYGLNMLTTAGYYHSGGAKEYRRMDTTLSSVDYQVDVDFGAVLYPLLSQLNISPSSVVAGNTTTGTVTIDQAAPAGGVTVNLQSSNTSWATPPLTVTIPEGQSSETFTITTYPVTGNSVVTITAILNEVYVSANLTVEASSAK